MGNATLRDKVGKKLNFFSCGLVGDKPVNFGLEEAHADSKNTVKMRS